VSLQQEQQKTKQNKKQTNEQTNKQTNRTTIYALDKNISFQIRKRIAYLATI